MHVTTGKAKGRKLKAVPGDTTRPITDKAKQALFNILQDDVVGTVWLDLFAGTGAVGIEALSRGAKQVTFIDRERLAANIIAENLRATQLASSGRVLNQDAFVYLSGSVTARYDFIYVAPPQYHSLWSGALLKIDQQPGWLAEAGEVIVQIDPREFDTLALENLELTEQRKYGRTLLCFYGRSGARSRE